MKNWFLLFFLFIFNESNSQNNLDSLKKDLFNRLSIIQDSIKGKAELSYIDLNKFRSLIDSITEKRGSWIFGNRGFYHYSVFCSETDVFLSYYYCNLLDGESYYYHCSPDEYGYPEISPKGIPIDTISNLVLTRVSKRRNILWRCMCRGETKKSDLIEGFKKNLFTLYQIQISTSIRGTNVYFIAPPNPKSKLKFRFVRTKF